MAATVLHKQLLQARPFQSGLAILPSVRAAASRAHVPVSTSGRTYSTSALTTLGQRRSVVMQATGSEEKPVNYNKEFGYSRKDVMLIGAGLIGLGYVMYYGLQAMGMEAGYAGNWVQLIIFLGICIGWVSTYVYRVATKQMTYVKQLEQYEEAVMRKRLEEMTESELADLARDVEKEKRQ